MNASNTVSLRHFLLAATILCSPLIITAPRPAAAQVSVTISVPTAPPVLPVYDQPPIPDVGYVWTPGYWAWDAADGYYWVPGTWVLPPQANVLWTPPYWAWSAGAYLFHAGYWGPQVGYYGGVDYGYGYGGRGYQGGRWQGGHFEYNRTANNFGSVHITNVYESNVTVVNNSHVSYEGGTGGLRAQPTADERRVEQEHHVPMTAVQTAHIEAAAKRPDFAATHNGGHPAILATSRPNQFEGAGVMRGEPSAANAHPGAPPVAGHAGEPSAQHDATRPDDHAVPAAAHGALPAIPTPAQRETGRLDEHGVPPAAHGALPAIPPPAQHEASRPDDHGVPPGVQHPTAVPAQHEAARPDDHGVQPEVRHPMAPPEQHQAVRPDEHMTQPPAAREAERPAEAPRPPERAAAQPPPPVQQHAAVPTPQAAHPAPAAHPGPERENGK
jgi:hypothetical protein